PPLLQPPAQVGPVYFRHVAVEDRGVPELLADNVQPGLPEIRPTPEHQPDARLLAAVADDRIALQEPHRMPVPDLVFGFRQVAVDLAREQLADLPAAGLLPRVVALGVLVHGCLP